MNAVLWLRVSSIVSLLFAAGHTLGGRTAWSPVGETDVLSAMRTHQYTVEGVSRSYLDFYLGFGYSLSVFLLLQAVILWQLCAIAKSNPALVRPIVGSFAVASIVGGIITWMFIFPLPALFSAALSACLVIAFFAAR
jgi:hypothetical protein